MIELDSQTAYSVTHKDVKDIEVTMVSGHMANLPFACVTMTDGTRMMIPIHNCRSIILDGP